MSERPYYYENVRTKAAMRWDQLESDPELAGPWHQLFKQVQSPRHILSELLQNADDAGATEASVKVENDVFIFEHNGEDFTEEHFSSLCRFGYSNKRALHTIGFRGIGFKSTFSLGDKVELFSPSLSIAFDRARFTEPKWNDASYSSSDLTAVRVGISDSHRKAEVLKNLSEWLKSPVSLLFFKNIRQLQIGEDVLKWKMLGQGPVPNSEWLSLSEEEHDRYLLCRSAPENFPEEALTEIRQERLLSEDEQADFPPSSVDVVLGAEGRLYVVLPTGVRTNLPFACNAPFVQDPARMKIKDPEISPTNRWLLERIGRLAATSMIAWLRNENSPQAEKATAYSWLPKNKYNDAELEGICADIVTRSFIEGIEGEQILLTESGDLVMSDRCVAIPSPLFDVWSSDQVSEIFDEQKRPAFCQAVSEENKSKLTEHGLLDQVRTNDFLEALRRNKIPKPESWRQLLNLWCFADPNINYRFFGKKGDLQLVPVQGKDFLIAANKSVRLGEKKLLQSDDDWQFIGDRISVVNQNWLRFLAEERRRSEEQGSNEHVVSAYAVLEAVGLGEPSDAAKVIGQVASDFFSVDEVSISDAIRIAQIAAKLGAATNDHFRYVTQDCVLRAVSQTVVFDDDASTELMVPEDWSEAHILHADYSKDFISCSREEWLKWISSGRSGLHTFVPIESKPSGYLYGLKMREEITRRHYVGKFSPKYKDPYFVISDWNFDEEVLEYWEERARAENDFWARVLEKILVQPNAMWTDKLSASAREYASNGKSKQVITTDLTPEWILFFRERICLKDSHGHYWKPSELLRRTPETEAVMDVEPFVHPLLDNENTRPLLIALGVGATPTGPDRLLDRLKGLSSASNAPTHEVEKWYRRLDQMIDVCSTEDFQKIRNSFLIERLILTEEGNWENTQGVYLTSNEAEVPGAEIVRSSVHDLTFWRKIGVSDRPTPDQAISWLQSLESGDVIPTEDIRRVRALLSRHAERIWHECGHWLNLSGKWSPIADIEYGVSMQSLVGTRHLHEWVKDKTANFQDLSADTLADFPFAGIPALAPQIEYRFHKQQNFQGSPEQRDWLEQLGKEISRIKDDDEEAARQVKEEGLRLSRTKWQTTPGLETIAYIDGTPAGLPRSTTSVWLDEVLYVEDFSMAKLAKPVAQELGRVFSRPDIIEAIKVCVDRNKKFISSYMEANFELGPYIEFVEEKDDAGGAPSLTGSPLVGPEKTEGSVQSVQTDESAQEANSSEAPSSEMAGVIEDDISEELKGLPQEDTTDAQDSRETDVPAETIEKNAADQSKPNKPSLIESYACLLGFRVDGNDRYTNGDGSWIARSESNNFPWAHYSSDGDVVQFFRTKEHCLRKNPLEIEAEIWEIIQNRPSRYSLILTDLDGSPWALDGEQLVSMQATHEITLYPAAYRMVLKDD